jgi:hypothetical protein
MEKMIRLHFMAMLWLLGLSVNAQKVRVQLDTDSIQLGDQRMMTISATHPKNWVLIWPDLFNQLPSQVQVIDKGHPDSVNHQAEEIQYIQRIKLGFYGEGKGTIPSYLFQFQSSNGEVFSQISDSLSFEVLSPEVNVSQPFMDITGPIDPGYHWKEFIPIILAVLGFIVLVLLSLWAWRKYQKRKLVPPPPPIIPVKSPLERALEAIAVLEQKEAWRTMPRQEYYDDLTRIIKQFLWGRYGFNAPDMDSTDIMRQLRLLVAQATLCDQLSDWFYAADMVKFAKADMREELSHKALKDLKAWISNAGEKPKPTDTAL